MLQPGLLTLVLAAHCADPIPEVVSEVQPRRLKADVERLVSFHTRHSFADTASEETGIGAARRWLVGEMDAISQATGGRLEVSTQTFTVSVRGREVEMVNVVGYLPGTQADPKGRTYIVSGHYDSRAGNGMDGESFAPGADDDASGTAVVLEVARVMAGQEYPANLYFLCVAGEEQGLYGSTHFAQWCEAEGVQVGGMITNDIVGGIEGGNGVTDEVTLRCFSRAEDGMHSPSRELARALQASAERYVADARVELIFRLDRFGRGGDHKPFDDRGMPAVRLTEANENYARQHQDVREEDGVQYGDLPEFVSGAYMGRVTRVNAACLAELALAPARPAPPRLRAAVSYDTQLSWEPVPGAAGYEVVWRKTTEPQWSNSMQVGPEVEVLESRRARRELVRVTVERVTADSYFFGVRALSAAGHRSLVAYPERP
jgi:Zn-dependent M28 family amino/carboxypeptidase